MICSITKVSGKYQIMCGSFPAVIGSRLFPRTGYPELEVTADTIEELPLKEWVDKFDAEEELRAKSVKKKRLSLIHI